MVNSKHFFTRLLTGFIFLCGFVPFAWSADTWKAGAAKIDITPPKLMWMAGYGGRDRPAEGKLTELWAKALVLEVADGERSLLLTLDLVGIDRQLSQAICASLKEHFGLERRQIAICTSHTHTGPVVGKNLRPLHYEVVDDDQKDLIDRYASYLHLKVVSVVAQAIDNLEPSTLSWGSGTTSFAVNRRNNTEAEVPRLREEGKLVGPFDHDVPVLAVRNKEGKLTAVAFGYACHCTVLSFYKWSGDYAGFAQMELEKAHPDCIALFWAGCGADQNPLPRRQVEHAQQYGKQLADAVEEVLSEKMRPINGQLSADYNEIDLPLDTLPTRDEIEQDAKSSNKFVAARANMFLAELNAGRELAQTYPYPVQVWRIGDEVQFITLGGEVVVDYALRLKSELNGKQTWVAGYANDVMAYIPSRRVLREGGYEGGGAMVYYGLPTTWAPDVEKLIVDEVHAQLKGDGQ